MSRQKDSQNISSGFMEETNSTVLNAEKQEYKIWQIVFWFFFTVGSLFVFLTASKVGVNADEDFQVKYSESLIDWYTGVKKDTATMSAVEKQCNALNFTYRNANMHYYGGFFEVLSGATNRILGNKPDQLSYHHVRHYLVAIFGLLAILFTAWSVKQIANQKAAILAMGLMFISPYYFGNSLMNPKDIPFCAGFAISLYYMIMFFKRMPDQINWKIVFGLAMGFTVALGTRAGGILLIAYFALFLLLHIGSTYGVGKFFNNKQLFLKYLKFAGIAVVGGYVGAVLFWPYALVSPITHPFKALSEFDKFAIGIRVLFQGENVMSDASPWYYAPQSIFQTTPLVVWAGFLGGILLSFALFKRYSFLPVFIGFFSAIFPVIYVVYKDSNMYNQWRHLLFVFPGIIIIASLAFNLIFEYFSAMSKALGLVFLTAIGLGAAPSAFHIFKNQDLSFVYYNEGVGGVKKQLGRNETDYWGLSVKGGIDYLEQQGILNDHMDKQVVIISNMGYALQTYTRKYGDKVKWLYASYPNRYKFKWDYALYTSLFVSGDQIRAGNWPMKSGTIQAITVDDVPVLAIMKQDTSQYVFKAQQYQKENRLPEAIEQLKSELQIHPDNEVALGNLVECYLNTGDFVGALGVSDALIRCSPENSTAYYMKGLAQAQKGDLSGAVSSLQICLRFSPDFAQARELLTRIRSAN
ncbi:MAG: tetratricopeptide repeat protein [Saprospiraceae bacterium]